MSTSFIYHAFGLQCYDYVRQDFVAGNIILSIQAKTDLSAALTVAPATSSKRGCSERWVKTVPIGFKPVWLVIPVQRIGCRDCGTIRRIDIGIAEPRRWYTKAFERYALALAKKMTMQDVPICSALVGIQSNPFLSAIFLAVSPSRNLETSNTSLLMKSVFEKVTNT